MYVVVRNFDRGTKGEVTENSKGGEIKNLFKLDPILLSGSSLPLATLSKINRP